MSGSRHTSTPGPSSRTASAGRRSKRRIERNSNSDSDELMSLPLGPRPSRRQRDKDSEDSEDSSEDDVDYVPSRGTSDGSNISDQLNSMSLSSEHDLD